MTVTGPNGTTETNQTYLDGQPRLVSGTGVVAQAFDYTTSGDKLYTKSVTGSTSVSGSRWTATYEDWAGRTTNTTQPGPNGNIIHDYLYYSGTTSGGGGRLRSRSP